MNFFIPNLRDKRLENFLTNFYAEFQAQKNITSAWENESFQSLFLQALPIAIRHHQTQKREALLNAMINAATNINIFEDFQYIFISYIDELTVSHIILLRCILNNLNALAQMKSYEELFSFFTSSTPISLDYDGLKLLCNGLENRGLVRFSSELVDKSGTKEPSALLLLEGKNSSDPMVRITEVGYLFLKFITKTA